MRCDEEDNDSDSDNNNDNDSVKEEKIWTAAVSRMKSYGWPEVVSVSGALPILVFVPKLADTGKGANEQR